MVDTVNPTTDTPRVTPSASQPVRIPWGDWLAQALAHATPIVEAAAEGAVSLALANVPMGSLINTFIGPQIIAQYVDLGLKTLEGVVDPLSISTSGTNPLVTTVTNLILNNEPAFASWVGGELEPMIKAALSKIGIHV